MKSNDDKLIREKLAGNEFPFEPQAWAQMEAMLDEKKKRRGFFWWWTGGIAAVLLLTIGTIGWGLYLLKEDEEITEIMFSNNAETVPTETKSGNYELQNANYEKTEETTMQNSSTNNSEVRSKKQEKNTVTNLAARSTFVQTDGSNEMNNQKRIARNKSEKISGETSSAYLSKRHHQRSNVLTIENPFASEVEMLNTATQKSLAENISMGRSEASLLHSVSKYAEPGFEKTENDELPKQKKKIFNYSLGVMANVSGTTIGKQTSGNLFYNQPSYMAGITHDFLFVNRVAITNSVLFSQTSFEVTTPITVSFPRQPLNYSSKITELAIPVGIKVYPVVKNHFRFYVSAGIINHIKLKESFVYNMPQDTLQVNSTPPTFDLFTNSSPPTQTDFTGSGFPYEKVSTNGLNSTEYVNTNDFSINSAKRYYASFYSNAGVEYVAQKHWIIFAEPQFHFSLHKIGVQDKRKYNVGVTAGFRYTF